MTTQFEIKISTSNSAELAAAARDLAKEFGGEVPGNHSSCRSAGESGEGSPSTPAEVLPPAAKTARKSAKKVQDPEPTEADLPPVIKVADLQDADPATLFENGGDDAETDDATDAGDEQDEDAPLSDDQKKQARGALMKLCEAGGDDAGRGVLIGEFQAENISALKAAQFDAFIERCAARVKEIRSAAKASKKEKK